MGLVHLPLLVPVFSQGRSRAIGELVCWRVGGSVMGLCAKWVQENFCSHHCLEEATILGEVFEHLRRQ